MKEIRFSVAGEQYSLPNRWEDLTPEQFIFLCQLLADYGAGKISPMQVKISLVCHCMDWDPQKIKESDAHANLFVLASRISFIFDIVYPDGVLDAIPAADRSQLRKCEPANLTDRKLSRYLSKQSYSYSVSSSFAAQLIPELKIGRKTIPGYSICTDQGMLTCSLTSLQFLEAIELLPLIKTHEQLQLLASILYFEGEYNAEMAHQRAELFAKVDPVTLQAISLNFQAFTSFLMCKTRFSILRSSADAAQERGISLSSVDELYALASDGLGDVHSLEQLNCITYLSILRRRLIVGVRALRDMKMENSEIAHKTGLHLSIIRQIV